MTLRWSSAAACSAEDLLLPRRRTIFWRSQNSTTNAMQARQGNLVSGTTGRIESHSSIPVLVPELRALSTQVLHHNDAMLTLIGRPSVALFARLVSAEVRAMQRPKSARLGPVGDQETVISPSDPSASQSPPSFQTEITGFAVGTVLSQRYEIVRLIGHGGMGAVYEAFDRELERKVAIKVIRRDLALDTEMVRRFKQELLLARQVSHRNVVRIFDIGEWESTRYISMEYVEGRELGEIVFRSGKLAHARAASIALQIAKALKAAHTEKVIHRDLKPQNIVIDENDRAYVMDFGIARSMEQSGMTQTGAIVGTLEYMSPEQAKGEIADQRSDLYAFGLIFYEMLTGVSAFKGDTPLASLYKRIQERPVPPAQLDSKIPHELSAIVSRCLEPRPEKRYQSAAEVIADIDAWLGYAPRTDFRHSRILIPHKSTIPLVLSVLIAFALFAGAAWYLLRGRAVATPQHAPVTVLVGDFSNYTGDPLFDGTLEPMVNVAMEGASFVNAFNRGEARKIAKQLVPESSKLDEQVTRLVALNQSIGTVVSGSISRRGDEYKLSAEALDGATGQSIASGEVIVPTKDDVLLAIPRLVIPIRKALGDSTSESAQLTASAGSFSVASLEALHQYGVAMEKQFAGDMQGALGSFTKAAELDTSFARAYAGMATTSRNLGKVDDAANYFKAAMEHVDRMTERERFRTRGAYYVVIGDLPKCVEEYSALVAKFPSDNIGHSNLAMCYNRLRNYPKAVEEAQRAVELSPNAAPQRMNLSLYSSYAGDFASGEREAREVQKINPKYEKGYLALADAQMGQGQVPQAKATYESLSRLSESGASLAASGLADVALFEGRFNDAIGILKRGIATDLAKDRKERAAEKSSSLALAYISSGRPKEAAAAAHEALKLSDSVKIRFLSGSVLAQLGDHRSAAMLGASLSAERHPEPKVYARLLEAESALASHDAEKAIALASEANKSLNTWVGKFILARAYIEAKSFAEADSELEACIRRKGEALEMMDDGPTFGMFPAVYYYQGVIRQGLKSAGYADSYRAFLDIRGSANEDPLLRHIHTQLASAH
jgi:eukaryotic-like serine/threonine-protein kinase